VGAGPKYVANVLPLAGQGCTALRSNTFPFMPAKVLRGESGASELTPIRLTAF